MYTHMYVTVYHVVRFTDDVKLREVIERSSYVTIDPRGLRGIANDLRPPPPIACSIIGLTIGLRA